MPQAPARPQLVTRLLASHGGQDWRYTLSGEGDSSPVGFGLEVALLDLRQAEELTGLGNASTAAFVGSGEP